MSPSKKKKRHGGGKPPRIITVEQRQQIETLAGLGLKQNEIAVVMKIPEITIRRRCAEELTNGVIKANSNIINRLYKQAIEGDKTLLIFWAKARCGWVEKQYHEITGKDGKDLIPTPVAHINIDKFTAEQIEAQLARTERLILALEGKAGGRGK